MTSRGITEIYSNGLIRGAGRKQGGGDMDVKSGVSARSPYFQPPGFEIGNKLTDEMRKKWEPKPMKKSGSGKKKRGKGKK